MCVIVLIFVFHCKLCYLLSACFVILFSIVALDAKHASFVSWKSRQACLSQLTALNGISGAWGET